MSILMRKFSQEELNEYLKTDGIKDFSNADLSELDLHDADLRRASFFNANLFKTNFSGANLEAAAFCNSHLVETNFESARLRFAYLSNVFALRSNFNNADLFCCNMSTSAFQKADFTGANLKCANLSNSSASEAIFHLADMSDICYQGLIIHGCSIDETIIIDIPMACPTEGSFIGWKKSRSGLIVKLEIPEDALRSSSVGRKCRANKAKILAIENVDGSDSGCKSTTSIYDRSFRYRVGQTITVPNFDTNRFNECAPGIHFFIDRQEAVEYQI